MLSLLSDKTRKAVNHSYARALYTTLKQRLICQWKIYRSGAGRLANDEAMRYGTTANTDKKAMVNEIQVGPHLGNSKDKKNDFKL